MYAEMLSVCIALSHNFTDKSLAIFKKSQNESPNGEKKITSEQDSRHDMKFLTRYLIKVFAMIILKKLK